MSSETTATAPAKKDRTLPKMFAIVILGLAVSTGLIQFTEWQTAGYVGAVFSCVGLLGTIVAFVHFRLVFPPVSPADGVYEFRTGMLGVVILTVFWISLPILVAIVGYDYRDMISTASEGFWSIVLIYGSLTVCLTYPPFRAVRTWKSRRDYIRVSKNGIDVFDDKQGSKSYDAGSITSMEFVRTQINRGDDEYALRVNGDHYELKYLNINGYANQIRDVLSEYYPEKLQLK